MLNVFHAALSLRGQSWAGQSWLYLQPTVRTIGGIFRLPLPPVR